jgi:predicted DNA-binding protein
MSKFQFESSPQVQFPLRLNKELHKRFTNVSSSTKIPKSTLGRLSITKFLDEVDVKGITTVLNEMGSV